MKLKPIPTNTVVHTPTEAEAKKLLAILHENGYEWSDGKPLSKNLHWNQNRNETCYCLEYYKSVSFSDVKWFEVNLYSILTLAEFKEKYVEEEKPQPKFKVGDKVKVIEPNCWHSGQIGIVRKARTSSEQVMVAFGEGGAANFYSEECLEPYTEPETKPTVKETKESEETFTSKELNLCELLKGREGEKFYSPMFGERVLIEIGDRDFPISFGEEEFYDFGIDGCWSDGGMPLLYPSRALYEQYPLDPYTAWMKWQEEQKKHWVSVTVWVDDLECESDAAIDTDKIYFRTPADRDKCIEEIKAIIEKYSK